jgi:hypothetical protein
MNEIRTWLDAQKIQPVAFKTVGCPTGLGFEISFQNEREATLFRDRFASLASRATRQP